jgi:hypothetical protein
MVGPGDGPNLKFIRVDQLIAFVIYSKDVVLHCGTPSNFVMLGNRVIALYEWT